MTETSTRTTPLLPCQVLAKSGGGNNDGTTFPHRFSSKIDLTKRRKRLWKVRACHNRSNTHTTMGGTVIPNNAWCRAVTTFNCSVWIEAGMRHYVVGKTEETSQMEHPPSLWWNQHTHNIETQRWRELKIWRWTLGWLGSQAERVRKGERGWKQDHHHILGIGKVMCRRCRGDGALRTDRGVGREVEEEKRVFFLLNRVMLISPSQASSHTKSPHTKPYSLHKH